MTDKAITNAISILSERGIAFKVSIEVPGGAKEYVLSAKHAALFATDSTMFYKVYFGVTEDHYRQWVYTLGKPLCAAKRKNGHLCNSKVGPSMGLVRWCQHHRAWYCHYHGGDIRHKFADKSKPLTVEHANADPT